MKTDNRIDDNVIMTEEDQRLNLAYENLSTIPRSLVENFATFVRILDISYNEFSDVSFLKDFTNLRSLILDHNRINADTQFPPLVDLDLLWLNHNKVSALFPFVKNLSRSFPGLRQLSLMGNPGVPADIDDTTFYQHLQYRLYTISFFAELNHLDSRDVTDYEHEEASRLYKRPWLERLLDNSNSVLNSARSSLNHLLLATRNSSNSNTPTVRQRSTFI